MATHPGPERWAVRREAGRCLRTSAENPVRRRVAFHATGKLQPVQRKSGKEARGGTRSAGPIRRGENRRASGAGAVRQEEVATCGKERPARLPRSNLTCGRSMEQSAAQDACLQNASGHRVAGGLSGSPQGGTWELNPRNMLGSILGGFALMAIMSLVGFGLTTWGIVKGVCSHRKGGQCASAD